MALATAKAAPLRPEIKLSQALSEFAAILSTEEKLSYNASSIPDPVAVMALTCEIDRQNAGRKTRRYGARLTTFLNSVKGFANIVDLIVGNVGNPIASAVWGAVKLSIQIASGFESYFESLSTMLMNIGLNSPRFEKYALLYPASTSLQKELCNYYAIVISLCTMIVLFVRKPAIKQIASALRKPFDDEFGKLQKDLTRLGTKVNEEVSLASRQQQNTDSIEATHERKESSIFRATGAVFRRETANELGRAKVWRESLIKSRFLGSCSRYNNETALNQARKKGASSWIFETAEYQNWRSSPCPSTLLCSGIVGAGKTIVCASVIENLVLHKPKDIAIGYFFCRDDEAISLKAREIIGSLARQFFEDVQSETFSQLDTSIGDITLNIEQILTHMKLLPQQKNYYIILDGLDECEYTEVEVLVESLQALLDPATSLFKLFWTGRSDFAARVSERFRPEYHVLVSQASNSDEIAKYVEVALVNALETERLKLRDPRIIVEIQDALEEKAQGMFLWVTFQIESLCSQNTDEDIVSSLEDLPDGLPATFRRILRRLPHSSGANPNLGRKIFEIVAVAQRPLTRDELAEAISILPGDTEWNQSKLINDVMKSLKSCGSFIVVDEEFSTVHFPHSSVKQHLLSEPTEQDVREYHFNASRANTNLGKIIVTYLNLDVLQTQLTKVSGPTQSYSTNIPGYVASSALPKHDLVNKMALAMLRSRRTPGKSSGLDVERSVTLLRERNIEAPRAFSLFSYGREYWLHHTKDIHRDLDHTYILWQELVNGSVNTVKLPWAPADFRALGSKSMSSLLSWLSENCHAALIEAAIRAIWNGMGVPIRFMDTSHLDRLLKILPYKLEDALQSLPKKPAGMLEVWLHAAAEGKWQAVMRLLIREGVNLNDESSTHGHVLRFAAKTENLSMARLLIEHGADVNLRERGCGSPLHAAAERSGPNAMAKLLLDNGADVNAKDLEYATPLIVAAARGDVHMVGLLLGRGAHVNAIVSSMSLRQDYYPTALITAVAGQHSVIVRTLLEAGADPNASLEFAARRQNKEIVMQLLKKGARLGHDPSISGTSTSLMVGMGTSRTIADMIFYNHLSRRNEDQNESI